MSEIILLSNVRLSFPALVEPKASAPGAVPKYSVDLLIDPQNPGWAQFMQQYAKLAGDKWKEHAQNVMNLIHGDRKLRCYGSGTERVDKKTFKPYLGYENVNYITASREQPPQMIQSDGTPVDPLNTMAYQALARKMYGGCYVNVAIRPWLQDNKHGRGVRCDLAAIQFARDGEAFGESEPDLTGVFGAVDTPATGAPAAPAMPDFMKM